MTDESGETYRIDKILISKLGLHIDARWNNPRSLAVTESLCKDFKVSIKFADGTTLSLEDNNKSANYKTAAKTANFDYSALFDIPVNLATIQAIIICDNEYPVTIYS